MNLATSELILNILGGNKFLAMTGAKDLVTTGNDLHFKLPKKAKNKINMIKIVALDLKKFSVSFYEFVPTKFIINKVTTLEISADELKASIESVTGLKLCLGSK